MEDMIAGETQAFKGILIYMGLIDLPEDHEYFQDDVCVCPTVRQGTAL
jgi:hypothetical protein